MSVIIIILLGSKCIKHESRARDLVRAPMSYKIIQKHDRKNDMKIIIVGAGKAGIRLARTLTEEGHDITILDNNANKLSAACSDNDVLGIIGNGMSYSSLSIFTRLKNFCASLGLIITVALSPECSSKFPDGI